MARISSVNRSPYRPDIQSLIDSGGSPASIHAQLTTRYGDYASIPSRKAIARYRASLMPTENVLPGHMTKRALANLEQSADALELLDQLISAQKQRVAKLWENEKSSGKRDPNLDVALRTTLRYIKERHRIAMDLGVDHQQGHQDHQSPSQPETAEEEGIYVPESHFKDMQEIIRLARARCANNLE